ncbi:MAG: hypothetical protein RLZZ98_1090, partial [Pseudomonadota bacterium]
MADWHNKINIKIRRFEKLWRKALTLSFVVYPLFLASCGSIPQPDLTPTGVPVAWRNTPAASAQPSEEAWWLALKDPVLNETVNLVLKNNLTVAQSYERLNAERALEKATLA